MVLPAAAAAGRQGRTRGVVLPAFRVVSCHLCRGQKMSVQNHARKKTASVD